MLLELVGGFKHFLFSIIYGMSSFPLTQIFQRGWNHQPENIIFLKSNTVSSISQHTHFEQCSTENHVLLYLFTVLNCWCVLHFVQLSTQSWSGDLLSTALCHLDDNTAFELPPICFQKRPEFPVVHIYLVGGLELFFYILGRINPTD